MHFVLLYKVLTVQSETLIKWVSRETVQVVPSCAVWGGCSPEGRPSYVTRVFNEKYIPANYEEGNNYVEYDRNGPQTSNDWDYLVFDKEMAGLYKTPFGASYPNIVNQTYYRG